MHLKRWLTGIIALPILFYLIGPGPGWLFYSVIFAAAVIGLLEYHRTVTPTLPRLVQWGNVGLTFTLFLVIFIRQFMLLLVPIVLWAFFPLAAFMLRNRPSAGDKTAEIGKALLGPVYVGLPLAMLVLMHMPPKGNLWIFFLLAVVFASDTGAFYAGKLFGRHKLYEAVSPGKTWEGAVGGLVTSIVAGIAFSRALSLHRPLVTIILLSAALSVAGQIGDLCESMMKRNHGVKDSGGILPGHGGILDRIDGLLFSIPVLYLYLTLTLR
jgi:phosphatidate cytidylyltransferase